MTLPPALLSHLTPLACALCVVQSIATNICGSDLHMYRGRTSFPAGMAFGHEITGEVVEVGSGVHTLSAGDWISVPFNISCGKCRNCKERKTQACLSVNPKMAGGAYGSRAHITHKQLPLPARTAL